MERGIVMSIEGEYQRYKALAEAAIDQLEEAQLGLAPAPSASAVAVVAWHVAGNLRSRFTDFLTTDGEKPWRDRDDEFAPRAPRREELHAHWERGWEVLFGALAALDDSQLSRSIRIRDQAMPVHAALHRSLAHTAYHVGQIVYAAKSLCGARWRWLSIPPGGSAAYRADPTSELGAAHAARLRQGDGAAPSPP